LERLVGPERAADVERAAWARAVAQEAVPNGEFVLGELRREGRRGQGG
jgi:hypothetical protein